LASLRITTTALLRYCGTAAKEERFTGKKHDPQFPKRAIEYCLAEGNVALADVDHIVFYDKPLVKFERLLES
jgi:carbamoyltransferase